MTKAGRVRKSEHDDLGMTVSYLKLFFGQNVNFEVKVMHSFSNIMLFFFPIDTWNVTAVVK